MRSPNVLKFSNTIFLVIFMMPATLGLQGGGSDGGSDGGGCGTWVFRVAYLDKLPGLRVVSGSHKELLAAQENLLE
jgi:hypothetical protein